MAGAIPFEHNQFANIEHESIERNAHLYVISKSNISKSNTSKSDVIHSKKNFELCLRFGNGLMLISFLAFVVAILVGYQFNAMMSMPVEIAAHIFSMILPGFFKIGYVLRCIGRKHLGKEV